MSAIIVDTVDCGGVTVDQKHKETHDELQRSGERNVRMREERE